MRAAMILERAGIPVSLFEARKRLGGRIQTIRHGNLSYDAGGEWLDADHGRALNLLQELGIEPDRASSWPGRVLFDGQECTADSLWNEAFEDELEVEGAIKEMCCGLDPVPWKNLHRRDWDLRNLADFLRENTSSKRGLWWVWANYRSDEGDDPEQVSLLGWLCTYLYYLDREEHSMSAYRVPGGMSTMIEGMADRLVAKPHLGTVLHRVRQDSECVILEFDTHEVEVDRVVLTLPPRALEKVVFEPALSSAKRCAIEACRMSRAIKIVWQFDCAWWRDSGWTGSLYYDGPLQQLWDASRGMAPALAAYVCGEEALSWTRLADPVGEALGELTRIFPEAARHFVRGWIHDWISDPFCHGAFSSTAPGYVLEYMQFIGGAEGRIHFAGEHTGQRLGFIEGAIESGERVAEEVLRA
jgi:monoamine oxidase